MVLILNDTHNMYRFLQKCAECVLQVFANAKTATITINYVFSINGHAPNMHKELTLADIFTTNVG